METGYVIQYLENGKKSCFVIVAVYIPQIILFVSVSYDRSNIDLIGYIIIGA
jgi:hypothetical protein